jgi:hypothetical protein
MCGVLYVLMACTAVLLYCCTAGVCRYTLSKDEHISNQGIYLGEPNCWTQRLNFRLQRLIIHWALYYQWPCAVFKLAVSTSMRCYASPLLQMTGHLPSQQHTEVVLV